MRSIILVLLFASLAVPSEAVPLCRALVSTAGSVEISCNGKVLCTMQPGLAEVGWRFNTGITSASDALPADGSRLGRLRTPGGVIVDSVLGSAPVAGGLHIIYRLTPEHDIRLNSFHVRVSIPTASAAGGEYRADGTVGMFPSASKQVLLVSKPMKTLELALRDGADLTFAFASATPVLLQDEYVWGGGFSARIGPEYGEAPVWPGGKPLVLDFTITAKGGMPVEYDGPVTIQAGTEWLPLDEDLDIEPGSALDFSKLIPWHAPAGKFGRVIATRSGAFAFADRPDKPVRFYGCDLCFGAQYLFHDQADRLARRLQMLGYNAVRIHNYEGLLVDRSKWDSTTLNPVALDQLDYLFAALKKRGIYVTTDLFVCRPVFNAEIWDGVPGDVLMEDFKMAVMVNDRAYANYITFAKNLLTHVNPYTGMRYADDPALAWLSLVNEDNAANFIGRLNGRLKDDWTRAWNRWLSTRFPTKDALRTAFGKSWSRTNVAGEIPLPDLIDDSQAGIQLAIFMADIEADFTRRTEGILKNTMGCNALITNLNGWTNNVQNQAARQSCDYVDDHFYVDHPQFIDQPWSLPSRCGNTSPVADGAPGGRSSAFLRMMDKPFTITEFNYAGPSRYRAVGGMLTGALGALQSWSAIWRYDYSSSREGVISPQFAGYFDLASDQLNQAADRAGIFLFRRGDLATAPHSLAIAMTRDELVANAHTSRTVCPDWNGLALVTRVGNQVVAGPSQGVQADMVLPLSGKLPDRGFGGHGIPLDPYSAGAGTNILAQMHKRGWLKVENPSDFSGPRFQSETGELTVDAPADTLTVDTPRTAGGFAPAGKKIHTKSAVITIQDTDATVWVSSLDGAPITKSRRLLITHLTDLQNSGEKFGDHARRTLYGWGGLPHLVLAGRATIALHLAHPEKAHVWELAVNGKRLAPIITKIADRSLIVPLDIDASGKARILYEVVL